MYVHILDVLPFVVYTLKSASWRRRVSRTNILGVCGLKALPDSVCLELIRDQIVYRQLHIRSRRLLKKRFAFKRIIPWQYPVGTQSEITKNIA